ncbi:endo-beta-N-acetylglucosaminidase H [Microbacterium karelineae]|uniref:endo-beta-N-acetylglucosaminidase H n=1 Tax=Microbacterium karelineae TaxID=2654283 RepID=UPI0012E99EC1|nr:endo-beta-N-acetylglucosaminidase H [Microbacterium karelineae]
MSRTTSPTSRARRTLAAAAVAAGAAAVAIGGPAAAAPGAPGVPAEQAADAAFAATGNGDPLTVAYVEVNSNELRHVGDYELEDGSNALDVAIIFAANINTDASGEAYLHLNEKVQATLDDAATQIRPLQEKGIKVTLSLLGNHDASGFANFPTREAAEAFADEVDDVVTTYGLDGVDIDDEWVRYGSDGVPAANEHSAAWLVDALDAKLPEDSIISLYDIGETAATLKDAPESTIDKLDYIWNPYYGQYNPPQFPTVEPARLGAAAVDLTATPEATAASLAERTVDDGFGAYVTYNLTAGDHSAYISSFTREMNGQETVYVG